MMVVFALGGDSGFQLGADGIVDDYDDEGGISVVLWCIIFIFLLVVTIWFYITQLTPRNVKCVEDEDVEDEEERVAKKLLNHLETGKCNSKNSQRNDEINVCRPSTSRESLDNYEVIDGEIRIHHSNYEWENESWCNSKGNERGVGDMSESLVRRHSMEEMSLIFPGFLPSITEEEEEDNENQENGYKEKGAFDGGVCEIRDLEGDIVKSSPNISPESNVYQDKAIANEYSSVNTEHSNTLAQKETYETIAYGKDISGRQITNRKGKQPAKNSKVTAEIRLRTTKISEVHSISNNDDKSHHDVISQVLRPAGSGAKESDVNENKFSALDLEKTSDSSQNMKSVIGISGPKAREFDPVDQNLDDNISTDCVEIQKEPVSALEKDFNADKKRSEFCEDAKKLPISALLNSNCSVNKNSDEDIICIETSDVNLQSEPDRGLNKLETNNTPENERSAGSMSKESDLPLSNSLTNSTFKGSDNMSNHLKHAWTFYSMSESTNNQLNEINGDHKNTNITAIKMQVQSQEIPKIVVDSYEEGKKLDDVSNIENDTWTRLGGQMDSFETDIDVDDVDLEEENDSEEGELNLYLKRHVSVTDLDKILFTSNEGDQDENHSQAKKFESEVVEESNLETIVHGINISAANKRVYTESSLDDIWGDFESTKNGTPTQNVKHLTEISEDTSKTRSSENIKHNVGRTDLENEFFSRQSVWTTLDQFTGNSEKIEDGRKEKFGSDSVVTIGIENKKREQVVDVMVSSKKIISSAKVDETSDETQKDVLERCSKIEPPRNEKKSIVDSLEQKMPKLNRGNEEESILSTSIITNEFSQINASESCEDVNKSDQTFHDGDETDKTRVKNLFVYGEVTLEPIRSNNKDSCKNITKTNAAKPENEGGFGRPDVDTTEYEVLLKRTKQERVADSSPTDVEETPDLHRTKVMEKIVPTDVDRKGVIAENSAKMLKQSDNVQNGRKENGDSMKREKMVQDSSHIDLNQPVSTRRRDDVIYGKRKTRKDDNGKRVDFTIRLNETSRNHEKVTSPYTGSSESEDDVASRKVTASDFIKPADQTCRDDVKFDELRPAGNKEGEERDTTQITQSCQVVEASSVNALEANYKSSISVDSTLKDSDKFTRKEETGCSLNVTQSSDTLKPEVNKPLQSAQDPSGETEVEKHSGITGKQNMSDKKILTNEEADGNKNYRVERRDVAPKIEKSIVLNPEKKQLQTLIKIDQVPDTHIGLQICMTGRFDVEQNKPITGLEKAEQIVANRLKRIEAEKKAAEEMKDKEKINREDSKETKIRKDYVPRKAKYDETRYRRSDRGRERGTPVDERVTPEESNSRKIQWNDFKLDDIVLDEINVPDKYPRIDDVADDFDLHGYQEETNIKRLDSEQIIDESVISETFTPRDIDWNLLEWDDSKKSERDIEIAEARVSSSHKKRQETSSNTVGISLDSRESANHDKSTEISYRKEASINIALQKASTPSSQKEIPQEEKENESKQKQYKADKEINLVRKKRSDVLKKTICDELSNMDIEEDESKDETSKPSPPSSEPEFPVRLTKSFSELRSVNRENQDAGRYRPSEGSSDPPTPGYLSVSQGSEDEVFTESPERVFKTRVTVDEVRGNKRRITILNIRKKSPGSTRWKSLNDIDSLSTVQKQIFKFKSISSQSDDDKRPDVHDSAQNGKPRETIFAVSGLSPTEELDSARKSEETRPLSSTASLQVSKEVPLESNIDGVGAESSESPNTKAKTNKDKGGTKVPSFKVPQERYRSRVRSAEEPIIPSTRDVPTTYFSFSEKSGEDKDTEGRTKTATSPSHSTDTGYHSKEEKSSVQSQSPLSPVTVQQTRSSPTGTVFALSRHSPTPLSDSESKTEKSSVQRQSSLSRETVQASRRSPTGTIFALSRHSPTPMSDSEKRIEGRNSQEDKMVSRQTSLEKTERRSRSGVSGKGTFFAVSRYSPATSDSETQGPFSTSRSSTELQPKYQTTGPPRRGPTVPVRSSSKKLVAENDVFVSEDKSRKDGSNRRIQDKEVGKEQHKTGKPKVHEKISGTRIIEMKEEPGRILKETTFPASGIECTTSAKRETSRQNESSSSRNTLTKLTSPDGEKNEDLSSDSDGEYRITNDGWLEKIPSSSSPSSADDQQSKIVKVTDLDSLLVGKTSSSKHITKEKSETLQKGKTSSVVSSITTKYNRNVSSSKSVLLPSRTELEKSSHTRITSTGVQETDLDALFGDEENKDLHASVQKKEETAESRTMVLRKTVVNRNCKILHTSENYVTSERLQPTEAVPVAVREAERSQEAPIVKAIPLVCESPAFGDLDDDVFTRFSEKSGVQQNGYRADGTYSSDADSETSSLNSVPLKPKSRHTRSSLEAVKSSVRAPRSPLSSDSSSAPTPIPSERSDTEFDPFHPLLSATSTPDRNRSYLQKGFTSRKATKESGRHGSRITAEGNGLLIDSSDGAAQRITRAYSESQMGDTVELRKSAFTPIRHREKERRSNSQENILSRIPDEQEAIRSRDIDPDLNTGTTFKEMANSHKSMPDLHKPQSESDAQQEKVPYHSRLSAHTRLWLSQTAGIDTSNLCKDDSVGSEIFLFPSNRFQPGKSVDASFLSIASDTDDVPDDVSTRPSSPMSEFSFAGEAPFGGDYQGDVIVVTCGNNFCGKDEIVRSQDKTSFTSCPSCFTYYCSSECRRAHWREHKKFCYFGRINSYMRSFVYFCHKKENLKLLLSKIATNNFSSKGRGCVMITFASPKQARKFMTSGCVLLPSPPSFSTVRALQEEGVVSKHKVNLIQQVKDYDPYKEFVLNLAIVAGKVDDLPLYPVPRHKLSTVLQCVRIPLCESLIQKPKTVVPDTNRETKVFYLPKCSRHEFVNDMEARRHYCRNISKSLREYGIRMKKDYPDAYDSLCLYVEKNIPFKPLTVYGNKDSKIIACKIMPEGYTSTTLI